MHVVGIPGVNEELRKIARKSGKLNHGNVIVGYTQRYAVYVHEVQAKHKTGKQWKYLEAPFRVLAPEIIKIVARIYEATGSVTKGLLVAGLRLQRESQKIVPIDTSALKASAYTALESKAPAAALAAQAKADATMDRVNAKRTVKARSKK